MIGLLTRWCFVFTLFARARVVLLLTSKVVLMTCDRESLPRRADYCIIFCYCNNSLREKYWRCRKRGAQSTCSEPAATEGGQGRAISPARGSAGPFCMGAHTAYESIGRIITTTSMFAMLWPQLVQFVAWMRAVHHLRCPVELSTGPSHM